MSLYRSTSKSGAVFGLLPTVLILLSCCISDPVHWDDGNGGDKEASAAFQYTLPSAGIAHFIIRGVSGGIQITGSADADSIDVRGERIVRSDDMEDAEEHLELLTVKIQQIGSEMVVTTEQPNRSEGRSYEVRYRVRLPRRMALDATLVNGNLTIDSLSGKVGAALTNGTVQCLNLRGECTATVVNGPILCDVVLPVQGKCFLSTVNGNVSLSVPDTTSASLNAKVTNGTVSVSNLEVKDLISSRTAVSGVLGDGSGTIELSAVNGNVVLKGRM